MDQSTKRVFNFVNLTHPDDLKDEETQIRIRRLAMTEVGRARRKPKTKKARNEVVLQFKSKESSVQPAPTIDRVGRGEIDPFVKYPVELDDKSRALVANIFRSNSNHATLLRGAWWPVGLSDASIFQVVLANSQLFFNMFRNGLSEPAVNTESLALHSKGLQLVSKKMKDPAQHTSDIILGAVAAFMCHDYIIGRYDSWSKHKEALMKMIELRGGLETITREELRISLSWADLAGSFPQDIPPSLPMPTKWLESSVSPPSSLRPAATISLVWKQQFPMQQDWISIFDDINQLISLDRASSDQQIEAAHSSGSWMEPTFVRLLTIRPLQRGLSSESVIEEVCRLGTLLFLSPMWRMMGASPTRTLAFSKNLLWVLQNHLVEWHDLKPLLLWTLYFAAFETQDTGQRYQFVFMLAVLMKGMKIKEWDGLMVIVKEVLWVDSVFSSSEEAMREEVMRIAAGSGVASGEGTPESQGA
ncbi:hypothetical protein P154DRAFT_527291 [Amniculicola lignicola CBS 123094]|uniref:Tachykinin family protein n=1 Tax=Amniculicola lignicola CBS 123094 TaxID=1392246 RepID=A0A6A5VWL5_9PLEO|nr:hypothetical protein P154DRAFT_527291 [Amniculicola lignicola CBS 123094]